MGEQRTSRLKRILQRVEEHVEDWRKQDAVLKAEADAMRGQMWAGRDSIEQLTKENRVVFVLHREEVVETLEDLASQGDRLVGVVLRKGGEAITAGLKGAWLVFEKSE